MSSSRSASSFAGSNLRLALLSSTMIAVALPFAAQAQTALSEAARPAQAQAGQIQFNVPPQELGSALTRVADQGGIRIFFTSAELAGFRANGVSGRMTVEQALSQILTGSGFGWRYREAGTVVIEQVPQTQGAIQLGPVRVEGETATTGTYVTNLPIDSPVTEGTGSYTTKQMAGSTGLPLSPLETPQSVSVVTRQRIDDQALQSLVDILRNTPGISATGLDSERTTFSARGFPISDFQYDGVSTNYKSQYAAGESELDSVIYDRVEVVRGATGLLTGAGQPSASINLVRKRANSKELAGTVSASLGSWDNYRATVDVSAPVTRDGRIRARLVGAYENKDSFVDGYHRERSTIYATADADLTSATTLSVGGSYYQGDAEGITYGGFPLYYTNGAAIDWESYGRSFSIWPKWNVEQTETYNGFAKLDHHFENGWVADLVGMYSKNKVDNTRLFPWGFPDATTGLMDQTPSRVKFPGSRVQKTVDLRLSGPFELAGRKHEAVFGLSYSDHRADFDRIGASSPAAALSLFDWASYPEPTWGAAVSSERYVRKQSAAYGALRFSVTDPLKVIIGGRYTSWEKSGAGYMGRNPYEYDKTKFIPYAGVLYSIDDRISLYGSYTSIFNPQDYQDRDGNYLDPLVGDSYEVGVKGAFFDGRLNAALAVFKINQDNLAQADAGYRVPGTTTQAYYGAKGASSKGVELEVSGEISPGWNLSFSASHFSAKDAKRVDVSTDSPRSTLRLFTTYRMSGRWAKLTVGGGANWQSRVYNVTGVYHTDPRIAVGRYQQDAYALVSLMARYEVAPNVLLQVNANNLFDKKYQAAVNFDEQWVWGAPRNLQATLSYKF